jgi:hypothetical protein
MSLAPRELALADHSQQLGHIDEVWLVRGQLFSAVSDFGADPLGPLW